MHVAPIGTIDTAAARIQSYRLESNPPVNLQIT